MTHEPDHPEGHRPDDLDALRDGLSRRSAAAGPTDPTGLYARARRQSDRLYRRQMGAGLAVAVLFAGALIGIITLNNGRASVGVSVGGPEDTTVGAPPPGVGGTLPAGVSSTTTGGPAISGAVNPFANCAPGFFSASTASALDSHFGSPVLCDRVGVTWLVVYQPEPGHSAAAAVLTCPGSDQVCLDPASPHDFARFLVVYLPSLGANPGGNWLSATISATPLDQPTSFDATFSVPNSATWAVPRWTLRLTRSDAGLGIQLGSTCQPATGPTKTAIMTTLSVVSGPTALAQAVPPATQSTPPTTAGPC